MKRFATFTGVIALAITFGLASAANAKPPAGRGGGPPGGGSAVYELFAPFIDLNFGGVATLADGQSSRGVVYSGGTWAVATGGLEAGRKHEVCLDATKAPDTTGSYAGLNVNDYLPLRLGEGHADQNGNFLKSGDLIDKYRNHNIAGDWAGLTILIYPDNDDPYDLGLDCSCLNPNFTPDPVCVEGTHVQESGMYIAK